MYKHTIIFKTGQLLLPEKTDLHFVTDLLHVGQLELDYIGSTAAVNNKNAEEATLLVFHFNTDQQLDYSMQESEINHLLSELLKNGNPKISTSGNDIKVDL
ncbi:hypothetical protein PQ462_10405 [Flavobacterium sp. KACC 22758]|jgi:hypothetical protein|uniref:hypothetical protein n=1 Tax=Flavobacterium sp. KACC 22758 TaxID=3025667 RepID=UPI000EADB138|nr:hypothetical protein [Flavobacterium sp. KACC 22758]WDF61782.1 hypothetical protein PQ462_10405 [Flavobacterium sp. KACC 22758]